MNYFGHAAVASWDAHPPGGALGAMLPDFAGMCGARLAEQTDPEVALGVALHHATDHMFHQLPAVTALMRELDGRLVRANCGRGPRMATAHVGIELLLDGVLVDEPAYRDSYTRALACDASRAAWQGDGNARFANLIARLRVYGVPDDLRDPDAITQRLARVLGGRKLLAPTPTDLRAIARALAEQQPRVEIAAATIMRGVRAKLYAPPPTA